MPGSKDDIYTPPTTKPPKVPPVATIGTNPRLRTGLGAKGVKPPVAPKPKIVRAPVAPRLTWSPLFGLQYGGNQARIGTYGPEVNQGDAWMSASDYLNQRVSESYSGSEPKGATYQPPEDVSWREYLADPTKPEEAAPSLVMQSRLMGQIARDLAALDAGGAEIDDGGYMFDSGGYGWDDGWGGGGGYSPYGYGPDSMLYMWRIGF